MPFKNKPRLFKGLWSSDQHTVNNRTPTSWIIDNLSHFFFRAHDLKEIDIIFFGGDLFDHLVDAANKDLRLVQHWIRDFLIQCKNNNVIVRVLEGTHSHDMDMPETFEIQKPEGLDLKWIKTVCVEYIKDLELSVLYVPDNLGHCTNEEIHTLAVTAIADSGREQVDMAAFHGMWDYQAIPHIKHKFHQTAAWYPLVKYIIFTGHVHIPSEYEKWRSSGSFDRIAYGEEHPKGGYEFSFNTQEGIFETQFWENVNALPYITIKIEKDENMHDVYDRIKKVVSNNQLPAFSRINLKGTDSALINSVAQIVRNKYRHLNFDIDTSANRKKYETETMLTSDTYVGVDVRPENIEGLVLPYIASTFEDAEMALPFSLEELGETLKEFL